MANHVVLKIKKNHPDAVIPEYAHPGDAAMDVTVVSVQYDMEHDCYIYDTGLIFETNCTAALYCFPRSHIYNFNYYLTNSVGIVDTKTYRGTIKAIFKCRDDITHRIMVVAMDEYVSLPWYKKLRRNALAKIFNRIAKDFLSNPLEYAPYKPGDRAFQVVLSPISPVDIREVDEVSETERDLGGHGSSGIHGPIKTKKS